MDWHAPVRSFHQVPTVEVETFADDVAAALGRLRSVGIEEVAVVDLTKPEFALPVVRVVIPGLEGPDGHAGYVRGPRATAVLEDRA